jgi:hypothetical protein
MCKSQGGVCACFNRGFLHHRSVLPNKNTARADLQSVCNSVELKFYLCKIRHKLQISEVSAPEIRHRLTSLSSHRRLPETPRF